MLRARRATALASIALLLASVHAPLACRPAAAADDSCVVCHSALPEPLNVPVEAMQHDIHAREGPVVRRLPRRRPNRDGRDIDVAREGLSRHAEARGDPGVLRALSRGRAYMRRFNPRLPTDQLQQYWTSVHGQRLAAGRPEGGDLRQLPRRARRSGPGPGRVARLPRQRVRPPAATATRTPSTWPSTGSRPTRKQRYRRSVHGEMLLVQRDFSAPACNDCHGNHGAFPPGVSSIAQVCGAVPRQQRRALCQEPAQPSVR